MGDSFKYSYTPSRYFFLYIDDTRLVAPRVLYNQIANDCMLLRWVKWNSVRIFLANYFERRCFSVVIFSKTSEKYLYDLHCASQALDRVDGGAFERFAKVGEVVGRFLQFKLPHFLTE